jgi:hypothetical protein
MAGTTTKLNGTPYFRASAIERKSMFECDPAIYMVELEQAYTSEL